MSTPSLSLRNKFLVALPSILDNPFTRTVTYICDHSNEGTMGLIINQPLELLLPDVFKQLNLPNTIDIANPKVLRGGPVKPQRGFLLHTAINSPLQTSIHVNDDLMLTASKDILESIAIGEGPSEFLFALGFAGWSPGQLENELKENCWLTVDADMDTLFNCPIETRWNSIYEKMGIDPSFIAQGGNA